MTTTRYTINSVPLENFFIKRELFEENTLWAWGDNSVGQLGDNSITSRPDPVQTVAGSVNWRKVSLGIDSAAAIKTDGTLWTWGLNNSGQLGDNTSVTKSSPVQTVAGGNNWRDVSVSNHVAAIKADGTLWTWGLNSNGQLGDNTATNQSSPVQVTGGGTWKKVAAGNFNTAAIKTDGTLWTWGGGIFGRLGNGSTGNTSRTSPFETVAGGNNWSDIGVGWGHMVAVKTDGTLWTWGHNLYSQLCISGTADTGTPQQAAIGGTDWKSVYCGYYHTLALKTDGTLWTWGSNDRGCLGRNFSGGETRTPAQTVAGGTNWTKIAASQFRSSAIKTDGSLWVWGSNEFNNANLGDSVHRSSPIQITAGGSWREVSISSVSNLALK